MLSTDSPKTMHSPFDDLFQRGRAGEGDWLSLTQFAAVCRVDAAWLGERIEHGMFPGIEFEGSQTRAGKFEAGKWRVFGDMVLRARLVRQLESDFGMMPLTQGSNP